MNCTWILHVEDFAKIKSADIQISPLLCFVGDNNSGKSYMMSLLWGILNLGRELFPARPYKSKKYTECLQWLKKNKDQDIEITDEVAEMYLDWFNELLDSQKETFLRKVFNFDVNIGAIRIHSLERKTKLQLTWNRQKENYSESPNQIQLPLLKKYNEIDHLVMNALLCWKLIMDGLTAPLPIKKERFGEPIYLPASRTGFMLTHRQLLADSLQTSFSVDTENEAMNEVSGLTRPYIDFLKLITLFDSSKSAKKYEEVVEFIEHEMTKGSLNAQKEYAPVIKYSPEGSDKMLPLYVASSVVAEISPILLTLKSDIRFNTMIIEEPEAHLHPALQKKMAQVILRLVNSGVPVWITTHSDTILQHFNNMMRLQGAASNYRKPLMDKYGYTDKDLISVNDVQMFQFEKNDNQTDIIPLQHGEYGFVVPTFNHALQDLVDEVYAFQNEELIAGGEE